MAKTKTLKAFTDADARNAAKPNLNPGNDEVNGGSGMDAEATKATVVLYGLGKKPRNGLNEGTKHGVKGTAGTYLAITKMLAEKDGKADMAAIQAVCANQNDKGFARYAVRNHWLQPIVAK
jgi:hypothetical protein